MRGASPPNGISHLLGLRFPPTFYFDLTRLPRLTGVIWLTEGLLDYLHCFYFSSNPSKKKCPKYQKSHKSLPLI
jgi:hypothetical protein